jgi:N-methylhydantoinase A
VAVEVQEARLVEADVPRLVEAFHKMHERIYSIRADADLVEFVAWKVKAIGDNPRQIGWRDCTIANQIGEPRPKGRRDVYLQELRRLEPLPVYAAESLAAGAVVAGPCLIEATTFTAMLKPNHQAEVDKLGNCLVRVS